MFRINPHLYQRRTGWFTEEPGPGWVMGGIVVFFPWPSLPLLVRKPISPILSLFPTDTHLPPLFPLNTNTNFALFLRNFDPLLSLSLSFFLIKVETFHGQARYRYAFLCGDTGTCFLVNSGVNPFLGSRRFGGKKEEISFSSLFLIVSSPSAGIGF